jgi:hypothetical protein
MAALGRQGRSRGPSGWATERGRTIRPGHPRRCGAALLTLATLFGCSSDDPGASASSAAVPGGALPSGVVAKVGPRLVRAETVAHIARAQGLEPAAALEAAVRDALLAVAAEGGPDAAQPEVRVGVVGVTAQALLRELWADAAAPEISSEELATAAARRWIDVDRPEGFRAVHAVVQLDAKADEATRTRARELAGRIRLAVAPVAEQARAAAAPERTAAERFRFDPRGVSDPAAEAFLRAAGSVDPAGLSVRSEALPVVAADGRVIDLGAEPGSSFAPEFAAAAAELSARGELSPPVSSSFGYHVILLLERLPARHASESELRAELRDGILADRGKRAHQQLLGQLRKGIRVEHATNVDALLAQVNVE